MRAVKADTGLQCLFHAALLPAQAAYLAQRAENQRVMGDDKIASPADGLVNYRFRKIQADEYARHLGGRGAHLQSGVVVFFLPVQGRGALDERGNVLNGHISR